MEEDDVVTYYDLDWAIKARICLAEGDMAALLALASKIGNLRLLGGFNGLRGSLGGEN